MASINWEDLTGLNIYASDNKALKCMKQKLIELQGKTDKYMIIVRDNS